MARFKLSENRLNLVSSYRADSSTFKMYGTYIVHVETKLLILFAITMHQIQVGVKLF